MNLSQHKQDPHKRRSIFRSLFIPMFLIMVLQAAIFYFTAVYGGIEESLNQNAADILSERLYTRKNELEARFTGKWSELDDCAALLDQRYQDYVERYGSDSLPQDAQLQIQFLGDSARQLIDVLRRNEVNGVFLILNDRLQPGAPTAGSQKYGLCIRDMDPDSNYTGTEDLLLERAPSSIVDTLGCSLDSWWEAKYSFTSEADGDYYYYPLAAAWENPGAKGRSLAYLSATHQLSDSDPAVISYSIPLISGDGYPYGVVGVELSTKYLASQLPNKELNEESKCCYVLALQNEGTTDCTPLVGVGALYNRCFGSEQAISCANTTATGGFLITGREDTALYGVSAQLDIYDNNDPFEDRQLTLLALVEKQTLFAYIGHIKNTLFLVSLFSLVMGVCGIVLVSRRFAAPITVLANRVRGMEPKGTFQLGRLGITEIDQLVDSIEALNQNISRNSARTEFFSRMSHDMRTPMNAIISFSSPALLEDVSEAVKDDYLNKIHASGQYLLSLINEVLDMTKIESNKIELHFQSIRADTLCETTIPIIEKLAQKKGVTFSTELSISPELYISVDVQHMDQIVMNLLSNAVKFTPEGGMVRLAVAMDEEAVAEGNIRCKILVSDTGIGMSDAFMKDLYTPFEQENNNQEGTGLGLSIAKKLVELMGGSIECVSHKNEGTRFTVTVPLAKSTAAQAAQMSATASVGVDPAILRGKRVLVCEDNAINRQIICRLLEKMELHVQTAENGQEGVAAFSASEPGFFDAVLMDIRMPVMDGLAATRAIRALTRRDAASVPIIAMTANAFQSDVQACEAAGMNAHLAKPIDVPKFCDTLVRLMR